MFAKKKETKFKSILNKKNLTEQKLNEEKLKSFESNPVNFNNPNNSFNNNLYNKNIQNVYQINEEEDDYNISLYNISLSKDKNFLSDIIFKDELLSKSLDFNDKLYFSERKNFGTNSVKFNENLISNLKSDDDLNYLLKNIQIFTKMNKERKKNYMIDLQTNNYYFNSIDNGSTKIKHRIISRFSKEFRKNIKQSESSTIPVQHSRIASQPFNEPNLNKNKVIKNMNYTINLYDDNINYKLLNGNNFSQYYTNENNRNKNINRILDLTNIYEETKMNGNSLTNLKYFNIDKINNKKIKKQNYNKEARLEEEYIFDSSGNQKFLCIKRFGEDNNNNDMNNLLIANMNLPLNRKNYKHNDNLKEIMIKNINMNYQNKMLKKMKSKKNKNINIIERFVFYSPQISYKNIFSPNNKNILSKLYKKVSDKKNVNQHYTSLIKEKDKINKNNIKISINNNLKNSKSCVFKNWQNKINNNKNSNNSYNIKFMNSFNEVINSENNIYKSNITNIKSDIDINGIDNHTINSNSRNNYNYITNNLDNTHKNLYSFNSLKNENNCIQENKNIYNSFRNQKENINKNNNDNGKVYFPFQNLENIKIDYSNKNNYKYHEIKSSKKKVIKKKISDPKTKINKSKIINLTSMDNIKILKKYNNLYRIIKEPAKDKKIKNK